MSELFEIAYAAASKRLSFFTGTGFSMAVSGGTAPSWQSLLESLCDLTGDPTKLKLSLFPPDKKSPLALEEAAQIISLELATCEKNIHDEIAKIIKTVHLSTHNIDVAEFLSTRSYRVLTTNYDKLLEQFSNVADCYSVSPGLPIPRAPYRVVVYHVHGSIDSPSDMVVTSNDYFRFMNGTTYFSRKLSTVLHEDTVVILGYSLGDTNLKAIISEYRAFSKSHVIGSNIFLISRSAVNQRVKDYYSHCYGIRVLDELEINDFFRLLNAEMQSAEAIAESSIDNAREVLFNGKTFTDAYLNTETSFFEVIASFGALGLSIDSPQAVSILGDMIKRKTKFTQEFGAWAQYSQLTRWLIHLGKLLELKDTSIESEYLDAVLRSMEAMHDGAVGYSWESYSCWNSDWPKITTSNRRLIKGHIEMKTKWAPALSVVKVI